LPLDTFHVYVLEAKNVAAMDKGGTSDPYVTLSCSMNKQKFKTKAHNKTLNPKWNENNHFQFFTSSEEGQIYLKMFDANLLFKSEFMGETSIDINKYADAEEHDVWLPLTSEPVKKKPDPNKTGEIHVKILFSGPPGYKPKKKKEVVEEDSKKDKKEKKKKKRKTLQQTLKITTIWDKNWEEEHFQ